MKRVELSGASYSRAPAAQANAFCISTSGYLALEGPDKALQNSGILTVVAFPMSTTNWCSWDGQPLQLVNHQKCARQMRPAFYLPRATGLLFALLTSA